MANCVYQKKHIQETKKHSRYSPYYRVLTSHNYLEESIDLFHCNIFFSVHERLFSKFNSVIYMQKIKMKTSWKGLKTIIFVCLIIFQNVDKMKLSEKKRFHQFSLSLRVTEQHVTDILIVFLCA